MRALVQCLTLCLALAPPAFAETWALPGADAYLAASVAAPALPEDHPAWPLAAKLTTPTTRYDHDVLGGIPHFTDLSLTAMACGACRHGSETAQIRLPDALVFEDFALRLWDVTGDARAEVVVVESHLTRGARLAVWTYDAQSGGTGNLRRLATTPHIGQPQRWLAVAGHGDFDGDGQIEIAYVDRPHLKRELVFVRVDGDQLREIARLPNLTNHGIGETAVQSGTRNCGQGAEIILQSADRHRLIAATPTQTTDLGPYSPQALTAALSCR